jgi:hypothetical protein
MPATTACVVDPTRATGGWNWAAVNRANLAPMLTRFASNPTQPRDCAGRPLASLGQCKRDF